MTPEITRPPVPALSQVFARLSAIRRLTVEAAEPEPDRDAGSLGGTGTVTVSAAGPGILEWEEEGAWRSRGGAPLPFRNRLRWSLDADGSLLRLAHLRRGEDAPVPLCEFVPVTETVMRAREPHRCGADVYAAELEIVAERIQIRWEVTGPRKQYHLFLSYAP